MTRFLLDHRLAAGFLAAASVMAFVVDEVALGVLFGGLGLLVYLFGG